MKAHRRLNIGHILTLVRENPGINRVEIARRLQLSKAAVSEIVRSLIEAGLVKEAGVSISKANGRRPIQLRLDYDSHQILGIDIGGTNLRGAVINLDGRVLFRHAEPTQQGERLSDQLLSLIGLLLREAREERVLGAGIGVAGTVDLLGRVLNAPALRLQDWDIVKLVKEHYKFPVLVDNDVNLAAVGERWRGAARGHKNAVCISIGTGIGAGLILERQLYRGSHNLAGEIGYFYHCDQLPKVPYNAFGALELVAGGYGMQQKAIQKLKAGTPSILTSLADEDVPAIDARLILRASANGDPLAKEVVRKAAFHIGVAVANIISLLDPDVVVLTGGIMQQTTEIIPIVEDVVRSVSLPEIRGKVKICPGELGDNAVLIGAAYQVQETYLPLAMMSKRRILSA